MNPFVNEWINQTMEDYKSIKHYSKLSPEIICKIFQFLPLSFLLKISITCKEWYSIIWNSPSLWKTLKLNLDGKKA